MYRKYFMLLHVRLFNHNGKILKNFNKMKNMCFLFLTGYIEVELEKLTVELKILNRFSILTLGRNKDH